MTTFLRVLDADNKAGALLAAIHDPGSAQGKQRFEVDPASFASVPRSPFAYWVADGVRNLFTEARSFEGSGRTAKCGMGTLDDFRFLRLWWERPAASDSKFWRPFAKGGAYSPYYSDVFLAVRWESDGTEVKTFVEAKVGSASRKVQATNFYFRPGITWPRRTQSGLALRAMPAGCIFADKGPAAFVEDDDPEQLLALLALMNSRPFHGLVELQMAFGSYEVGVIQRTPCPRVTAQDQSTLAQLARRSWSLKYWLDTVNETSHAFVLPPGPNEIRTGLAPAQIERELAQIQAAIDEMGYELYGIEDEHRLAMEAKAANPAPADQSPEDDEGDPDEDGTDIGLVTAPVATLISWFVGVAFGRFDERLATGERAVPAPPEPFDRLPDQSAGMWPVDDAPLFLPPDILVDDRGHNQDIVTHVASAMAHTGWPDPADLREWLAGEFFPLHLKVYSKSRRQAPIYWPFSTASGSYTLWSYYPRLTDQTLYACVNEFLQPKIHDLERDIPRLRDEKRTKELQAAVVLMAELEELRHELLTWAPRWKPNLNDGVLITACPLWKLFRLPKWRKDLEACWKKLEAGDYDWAHLAYSLWPERVREKCKKDRSFAIAHGLEEICEVEPPKPKKGKKGRRVRKRDDGAAQMELGADGSG
jgi:hypothetical protein